MFPFSPRTKIEDAAQLRRAVAGLRHALPVPYRVRSAKATLAAGEGHCLEQALAGAYLAESLGMAPTVMAFALQDLSSEPKAHAVCAYPERGGYAGVGGSRYPELRAPLESASLQGLAEAYGDVLRTLGYRIERWLVADLRGASIDWRRGKSDIAPGIRDYLYRVCAPQFREMR